MKLRTYSELRQLETFKERYDYLQLRGSVGRPTFGSERYVNQAFYRSREWRNTRNIVITRDLGCDLGISDREIHDKLYVHHLNPMSIEALEEGSFDIVDPENLITTSHRTHNAIHYGDASLLAKDPTPRTSGDTKLW